VRFCAYSLRSNSVNMSGGKVGLDLYGGSSGSGNAVSNSVNMSGGTVQVNVYGGSSVSGNSMGNSVTISGGTVQGNVYGEGGNVYGGYVFDGTSMSTATNNIVTISGNPVFGPTTGLFGGWTDIGDAFTGNTLNLYSPNVTVASLQNFEYLNFFLPSTMGNAGVMLNVNNVANITDSIVNVGVEGASSPLKEGDHVVLIHTPGAGYLIGTPVNTTAGGQGMQGVTLRYLFDIEVRGDNDNELWAILRKVSVNPETEVLSKSFLSGVSLLNQTGDFISWHGMSGAVSAAKQARCRSYGIFFDVSGGWSRYDTGCHVDMSGLSLVTGLSKYVNLNSGSMTLGGFFEYGNGSYDTFNSFSNTSLHGNGNLHHFGGGILGRMDFRNHFYAEGSFRAGQVNNEYINGDLQDAMGRAASYDSSSAYYGLHVGGGKIWNITNHATLDLYGKYLWTQQQGDLVTLSTGDPVGFPKCELPPHPFRRTSHRCHEPSLQVVFRCSLGTRVRRCRPCHDQRLCHRRSFPSRRHGRRRTWRLLETGGLSRLPRRYGRPGIRRQT